MSKYSDRLVIITDEIYGVFEIDADSYPEEYFSNIQSIKRMDKSAVPNHLLKNIGRNILSKAGFDLYKDCGKIFYRKNNGGF